MLAEFSVTCLVKFHRSWAKVSAKKVGENDFPELMKVVPNGYRFHDGQSHAVDGLKFEGKRLDSKVFYWSSCVIEFNREH